MKGGSKDTAEKSSEGNKKNYCWASNLSDPQNNIISCNF